MIIPIRCYTCGEVLADKWPELANKLSVSIEANLLEKDSNYDY